MFTLLFILLAAGLIFSGAFIPMLQLLFTLILWTVAGCPDANAHTKPKAAPAAHEQTVEEWLEDGGERAGKAAAEATRATKKAVQAGRRKLQEAARKAAEETHGGEP